MRKERLYSILRKAVIAALVVSALFLVTRTDYFSALGRTLPAPAQEEGASASAEGADALRPRAVMACYADGGRAASAYDGETTRGAFLHFAALLGEALGSAGAPVEIAEAEFRAGTGAEGVFIDLGLPVPLDLLTDWLGAGAFAAAGVSADILHLGLAEDGVFLCFRDGDGGFRRCATAAQAEALGARIADFQAGDAYFAYENALLEGTEPYMTVLETMPAVMAASVSGARDEAAPEALLEAVGMNSYVASYYGEADGTAVYVEDEQSLRLGPEGTAVYRGAAAPDGSADDLTGAVERAYRLARETALACGGDADVMFSGAEAGADGTYTVYFDYCLNGVPVRLPDGHAIAAELSGGAVTRARAALRRYTLSGGYETVLPMLQAAAIAASGDGGAPELVYMDTGNTLRCVWVDE